MVAPPCAWSELQGIGGRKMDFLEVVSGIEKDEVLEGKVA